MSDGIAKWLIKHRLILLTLGAVLALAALPFSLTTETDLSVQSLFPTNDPKLSLYNRTASEFGVCESPIKG